MSESSKSLNKVFLSFIISTFFVSCEMVELQEQPLPDLLSDDISQDQFRTSECAKNLINQNDLSNTQKVAVIDGKIKELIIDHVDGSHSKSLSFESSDNHLSFEIDKNDSQINNLPLNMHMQVAIQRKSDGQLQFYKKNGKFLTQTNCLNADRNLAPLRRTQMNKNVGFYFQKEAEEGAGNSIEEITSNTVGNVLAYLRQMSQGKWQVSGKGYNIYMDCSQYDKSWKCTEEFKRMARSKSSEMGHTYTSVIYRYYATTRCGQAQIGGTFSENWGYPCRYGTYIHELGHNFGLHHSNAEGKEYGDSGSSVMGRSTNKAPLLSAQKEYLGIHHPAYKILLDKTQKVFIAPTEWEEYKLFPGVMQTVEFTFPDKRRYENYYISVRAEKGYSFLVPNAYRKKVFIHKLTQDKHTERIASLSEGESWTSPDDKYKVTAVKRADSEIFEVDFYYDENDPAPGAQEFPIKDNYSCLGNAPFNSVLCEGDADGLSGDLESLLVNTCTSRKCEYQCAPGFNVSSDGSSCEAEPQYSCSGATPSNSRLCSGDASNLNRNVAKLLVQSCSNSRKCEYTCNSGYQFENGQCVKINPIIIHLSKITYRGTEARSFKLGRDTLYWRVRNAGPNAKACAQYQGSGSFSNRGNWGRCENLADNSPNWTVMTTNDEWKFNETYQSWWLKQDLTQPTYYVPGRYKFFWFNPDTGEKKTLEMIVNE